MRCMLADFATYYVNTMRRAVYAQEKNLLIEFCKDALFRLLCGTARAARCTKDSHM